jgi:predicted phosphate transport protein (TIGR00153 family)
MLRSIPGEDETLMLGWFQALMPKEERFFELFVRHATIVLAGAEALRDLLQDGERTEYYCKRIFDHEAEADEITRQVLGAVRRTFITPFDRSDIQDLATSLDDAIDQMNKTAKNIALFEVRHFEPHMQQMGDVIVEAAKLVVEAMPLLSSIGKNAAQLNKLTEAIIRVEDRADQLHDQGRKALFLTNRQAKGDAMNFVVGAELYEHLEKVVDRFEDVSNEINAIVTDHL